MSWFKGSVSGRIAVELPRGVLSVSDRRIVLKLAVASGDPSGVVFVASLLGEALGLSCQGEGRGNGVGVVISAGYERAAVLVKFLSTTAAGQGLCCGKKNFLQPTLVVANLRVQLHFRQRQPASLGIPTELRQLGQYASKVQGFAIREPVVQQLVDPPAFANDIAGGNRFAEVGSVGHRCMKQVVLANQARHQLPLSQSYRSKSRR